MNCENCGYFSKIASPATIGDEEPQVIGECRARPPVVMAVDTSAFPVVSGNSWCGEHIRKRFCDGR